MSNELKHAAVICHMATHGYESVEAALPNGSFLPAGGHFNPLNCPDLAWRIKPETITFTVKVPRPMQSQPKNGEPYFAITQGGIFEFLWESEQSDFACFKSGNCWATQADAQQAFDALFGPLRNVK
jgi:hypothetical protein